MLWLFLEGDILGKVLEIFRRNFIIRMFTSNISSLGEEDLVGDPVVTFADKIFSSYRML